MVENLASTLTATKKYINRSIILRYESLGLIIDCRLNGIEVSHALILWFNSGITVFFFGFFWLFFSFQQEKTQ